MTLVGFSCSHHTWSYFILWVKVQSHHISSHSISMWNGAKHIGLLNWSRHVCFMLTSISLNSDTRAAFQWTIQWPVWGGLTSHLGNIDCLNVYGTAVWNNKSSRGGGALLGCSECEDSDRGCCCQVLYKTLYNCINYNFEDYCC